MKSESLSCKRIWYRDSESSHLNGDFTSSPAEADILLFSHSNSLFYTATYGVSATLLAKILDVSNETIYSINSKVPSGVLWSLTFEPLPTKITKIGALKGGNSLGTTPADGNGVGKYQLLVPSAKPSVPHVDS